MSKKSKVPQGILSRADITPMGPREKIIEPKAGEEVTSDHAAGQDDAHADRAQQRLHEQGEELEKRMEDDAVVPGVPVQDAPVTPIVHHLMIDAPSGGTFVPGQQYWICLGWVKNHAPLVRAAALSARGSAALIKGHPAQRMTDDETDIEDIYTFQVQGVGVLQVMLSVYWVPVDGLERVEAQLFNFGDQVGAAPMAEQGPR